MTSPTQPDTRELSAAGESAPWSPDGPDHRNRSRPGRNRAVLAIVVVATLVGAGIGIGFAVSSGSSSHGAVPTSSAPTSTATVAQRNLSSQVNESGTLGYASSWSVINGANGTLTQLPAGGDVVSQGQPLYHVDGAPVVLLYGPTPVYRSLQAGVTDGPDVAELNWDLIALGYLSYSNLSSLDDFNWATTSALEQLQAALGVSQTGALVAGQAVVLPGAVRVDSVSATLGAAAAPKQPIMTATSTARVVTVNLDAAQQGLVKVGDQVQISLPNNTSTPATVSAVGGVATPSSSGPATVQVIITPTDAAATGTLDQAPVQVAITTATVDHSLVVPVNSLLALASGGYGVEVVDPGGHRRLVAVSLGLFDDADGLVAVTGNGISAGMRVVVPSQ